MWTVISRTIQEFNGVRYYRCGRYFRRDGQLLHRVVYASVHGRIPAGHHVHHIDHDPANNAVGNLVLMLHGPHMSQHMRDPRRRAAAARSIRSSPVQRAAAAWHGSAAGRAWHRLHAQESAWHQPRYRHTCEWCGKSYPTTRSQTARFCSRNCATKYRKRTGIDNETRTCSVCGRVFTINKYARAQACSRRCATVRAWTARRLASRRE